MSEGTVTTWLKQVGEHDQGRRDAARDLDRQGRHRGALPGGGRARRDPRPGGRDGRRRHAARRDRARRRRGRRRRRTADGDAPGARDRAGRRPSERRERLARDAPTAETVEGPTPAPRRPHPRRRASPTRRRRERQRQELRLARRRAHGRRARPRHRQIPGTGRGGRVTKKDILAFVEGGGKAQAAPQRPHAGPAAPAAPAAPPPRRTGAAARRPPAPRRARPRVGESLEPMTAMRRGIARTCAARSTRRAHVDDLRGRHVEGRRDPQKLKKEFEERLRRQALVPRVHRARRGRGAPRLPAGERRDARRPDRQAPRQPRLRRLAQRRQGSDRPGDPQNAEELNLLGIARALDRPRRARARRRSCCPTRSRAARSRSRTPAASARSSARRSSASRRPRSSARTRSSSARGRHRRARQDSIAIRPIMNLALTYDHRLVDGAYARSSCATCATLETGTSARGRRAELGLLDGAAAPTC